MGNLLSQLQGLQQQAIQRIATRQALADAAKTAWSDAEAQYQVQFKTMTNDDTLFQNQVKIVNNARAELDAQTARVKSMSFDLTDRTVEITNDEAIIKLILSEISKLEALPVRPPPSPSVRLPASAAF